VSRAWERYPKKTNLYGLYYGNGKTLPRERTDRVRDRVNACLQAFAESDLLREIQAVPFVDWKPIDQLDTFTVDGLKVWCAIDFAYHDPAGSLRIIDWKTGAEKSEALQTQLACYTLYAQEKWFTPPERIRTAGVFLREDARCAEYPVTPENLIAARDYMLTSAAGMRNRLRDVEANTAGEADFPLTNHENACHSCNFRQACPRFADVDP
jgi:RecB family exonuclease